MPFTIASKRKEYLGVNLTKNVIKTCILKTVKTLMKELMKIQVNGKIVCAHGLEE